MIPGFDGAPFGSDSKEALWARSFGERHDDRGDPSVIQLRSAAPRHQPPAGCRRRQAAAWFSISTCPPSARPGWLPAGSFPKSDCTGLGKSWSCLNEPCRGLYDQGGFGLGSKTTSGAPKVADSKLQVGEYSNSKSATCVNLLFPLCYVRRNESYCQMAKHVSKRPRPNWACPSEKQGCRLFRLVEHEREIAITARVLRAIGDLRKASPMLE